MDNTALLETGLNIAKTYDVSTKENSVVVYSISFQPTPTNREKAFSFVKENPEKMLIEHTECGGKLVEMGFESATTLPAEDLMMIWMEASRRFICSAKGNVTAFVENAHPQSVFMTVELPNILINPNILTVNGIDKHTFANSLKK